MRKKIVLELKYDSALMDGYGPEAKVELMRRVLVGAYHVVPLPDPSDEEIPLDMDE